MCAGHGAKLGGESPLRSDLRRFVSLGKGVHREVEYGPALFPSSKNTHTNAL